MLVNLISNAIKFTYTGEIQVVLSEILEDNNLLRVEVKDTGTGIEEDKIKNLFKPFNTYSQKAVENKEGIGLGLSICREFICILGPS